MSKFPDDLPKAVVCSTGDADIQQGFEIAQVTAECAEYSGTSSEILERCVAKKWLGDETSVVV